MLPESKVREVCVDYSLRSEPKLREACVGGGEEAGGGGGVHS